MLSDTINLFNSYAVFCHLGERKQDVLGRIWSQGEKDNFLLPFNIAY